MLWGSPGLAAPLARPPGRPSAGAETRPASSSPPPPTREAAEPGRSLTSEAVRDAVLARLAHRRPVFHSERDLQHELANEIGSIDLVYARVDQPVQVGMERFKLDVLAAAYRGLRQRVGFAVRYLSRRFAWTDPSTNERYALRESTPLDRFAFLLDLGRLERAVRAGVVDAGCAILLSNDASLWAPGEFHEYDAWVVELLSIFQEGGTIALDQLHAQSSDGFWWGLRVGGPLLAESWDESTIAKDPAARQQAFEAFRRLPYIFREAYRARWRPYSELDSSARGTFRYLALGVG
jgi:hypothetical protein